MNTYDLLEHGFKTKFNPSKAQATMGELSTEYAAKGVAAFSADAITSQAEDEHYINKLVLHGCIGQYAKRYPSIRQQKIRILVRDKNSMSATLEKESKDDQYIIFIDDVLSMATLDILGILIYWEIHYADAGKTEECYSHLSYILDTLCMRVQKTATTEKWRESFMKEICLHNEQTVHLLGDLFLTMQAFVINHELAHLVLGHNRKSRGLVQELEADKLAYTSLCEEIVEIQAVLSSSEMKKNETYLLPYTYLVPPMLFDIYLLIEYYRDKCKSDFPILDFESLSVRQNHLMDVPDDFDIDSHEGNIVYNSFLNSIDAFKEMCEKHFVK